MRSRVWVGALFLMIAGTGTTAAGSLDLPQRVASELNISADSPKGWTPTADQRQRALKTLQAFIDAIESQRFAVAYGLLTEGNKKMQSPGQFNEQNEKFRQLTGQTRSRRALKITWTKDSPRAPNLGTYVAVDFSAKFAEVDRNCGYVILYQPPTGGDFTVTRYENNYLDNATARKIEEQRSKAEVDRVWTALSRQCPNYDASADAK